MTTYYSAFHVTPCQLSFSLLITFPVCPSRMIHRKSSLFCSVQVRQPSKSSMAFAFDRLIVVGSIDHHSFPSHRPLSHYCSRLVVLLQDSSMSRKTRTLAHHLSMEWHDWHESGGNWKNIDMYLICRRAKFDLWVLLAEFAPVFRISLRLLAAAAPAHLSAFKPYAWRSLFKDSD